MHAVIRLKLVPRAAARTGRRRVLRPCSASLQVPARLAPFGPRVTCRVQRAEELLASRALRRWCACLREYRILHAPARQFSCMQHAPGIAVHACSRPCAHAHTKHARKRALPRLPRQSCENTHTHTHIHTHTGYLPAALPRSCGGCWPCRFADAAFRLPGLPREWREPPTGCASRPRSRYAGAPGAKGRAARGKLLSGTCTAANTHPRTPTHMRPHEAVACHCSYFHSSAGCRCSSWRDLWDDGHGGRGSGPASTQACGAAVDLLGRRRRRRRRRVCGRPQRPPQHRQPRGQTERERIRTRR